MRQRLNGINVRVTESEKKKLADLSKKCDLSLSAYLRNLGLGKKVNAFPMEDFYRIYKSLSLVLRELSWLSKEQIESRLKDIKDEILEIYLRENTGDGDGDHENSARP